MNFLRNLFKKKEQDEQRESQEQTSYAVRADSNAQELKRERPGKSNGEGATRQVETAADSQGATNTQHLVFMKQLLENAEYANEQGVLNVLKLFRHKDTDVREGTSYAPGAFSTIQRLIELRRELFTDRIIQELTELSKGSDERSRSAARAALEKLKGSGKVDAQTAAGLPPLEPKYLQARFVQVEDDAGTGRSQFNEAIQCGNRLEFDKAFVLFEQAIGLGLAPTYECYAHSQLGVINLRQKKLASAVEQLLKCLAVQPKTATAAWEAASRLCIIYEEAGMPQDASALRTLAASANTRGLYLEASYESELRELVKESLRLGTLSGKGA